MLEAKLSGVGSGMHDSVPSILLSLDPNGVTIEHLTLKTVNWGSLLRCRVSKGLSIDEGPSN